MKKIGLLLILITTSPTLFAQWTTSGSDIYFSAGSVGIGNSAIDISGTTLDQLVVGNGSGAQGIVVYHGNSSDGGYAFSNADGNLSGRFLYDSSEDQIKLQHGAADKIRYSSSDIELLENTSIAGNFTLNNSRYIYMGSVNDRIKAENGSIGIYPNANLYIGAVISGSEVRNVTFLENGNIGLGTESPAQKLHVDGSIRIDQPGRLYFDRSNVNSELFLSTNGQGGGLMFNATYGGSGNPQGNTSFKVEPGQYNTAAGYLDFDGNSKNWSINISDASTGIGSPVTFKRLAYFDNSQIVLSPTGNSIDFHLKEDGFLGIGTSNPDQKLTVKGKIHSEEIIVDLNVPGPDYVFEPDYNLTTLTELEAFIQANKHLPEIPSAATMEEEGIILGEMNMLLLKKIEELTLHTIEQQKLIEEMTSSMINQEKRIQQLEEKQ